MRGVISTRSAWWGITHCRVASRSTRPTAMRCSRVTSPTLPHRSLRSRLRFRGGSLRRSTAVLPRIRPRATPPGRSSRRASPGRWRKRGGRRGGVYGVLAGLAVPLLTLNFFAPTERGARWFAAGFIAWILLLPIAFMFSRVRRLLAAGFDRHDLTEAMQVELARRREELAFLYGHPPSRLER